MTKKLDKHVEAQYQKVAGAEVFGKSDIPTSYGLGVRHIQILLGFLSLAVGYISRAHMGVTIVAMTNTLHSQSYNMTEDSLKMSSDVTEDFVINTTAWEDMDYENEITIDFDYETENNTAEKLHKRKRYAIALINSSDSSETHASINRKYDWPKSTQEMVLGSFFVGYTIMMIPMGMVCQRFGGKIPMQIALFVSGIATIVTPWIAAWGGWKAVCACRILQGLTQAGYYPGLQTLVARWAPADELGKFYSWAFTGSIFGTVIAFQLAGVLTALGWPCIYWVIGSMCLIMFLIMTIFGAASPAQHKSISELEKKYITGNAKIEKKKLKVPFKAVLKSRHVWATWFSHIGSTVGFVFMFSQVPTYIHYILNLDVKNSGLLSSLPYIASFITGVILGPTSDYITNKNILSIKNSRKMFNSLGMFGMALCFIGASFTKNVELAIFCLVMAMSCQTLLHTGWMVNYIDLSPNFSGSLMSFGNTITYSAISAQPLLVSYVVTDVTNQLQWRIIFLAMAGLATVTNIIFVIFMSAEKQPWNEAGYEPTETEETEKNGKSQLYLKVK